MKNIFEGLHVQEGKYVKFAIGKKIKGSIRRFRLNVPAEIERLPATWRYGVAVICVLVAFVLRYFLDPLLGPHAAFILFVPAVIMAAWYGGIGPSIVAITASALLTDYFFAAPQNQWKPIRASGIAAVAIYLFASLVVIALMNAIRRERARVMSKAAELLAQTERLEQEAERRKQVEMELRESEERLHAIVNCSPAMIFLKDLEGRYLLSNNEFENITHRPGREIIGKTDNDIFPFQQAHAFRSHDAEVLKTGVAQDFEEIALQDDGPHTSIVHKFPLRDTTGKIYALGGISTDITQRKRDEDALRKARQNYADLVDNIDGIVWEADPATLSFSFVSQQAERLLGYPLELWRSEDFWAEHLHPDDRDWAVKFCEKQIREKRDHDFEYRFIAADGRTVWVRDIVSLKVENGGTLKLRGIMVDITAQKEAERALRESEEKYHSLYNNTPVMLHSIGPNGELLSVSNFWLNTLGYKRNEVIGQKSLAFLTLESQAYAKEVVLPEFFKLGVCRDVPYQMVKKNGEIIDVLVSAIAEKDDQGNVLRSMAVIVDVTDRKRAEQALRASEERLRILAETAVDAIVSADIYGNIVQFNPAAEKIFGRSAQEMLGTSISVLMPERYRQVCHKGIQRFLATGEAHLIGTTLELAGLRKDGTEFPLELSLSAWESSEGKFFTAVLRDITERKQAQETIRRNEKLLRMTTEAAKVYVWNWDIIHGTVESPGMNRVTGEGNVMSLQRIREYVHPEDRAWVIEESENCIREDREFDAEYRIIWEDGSVHWELSKGQPFYEEGRPVRFSGISIDVTERKQAQETIRRNEEFLRMTTDAANIYLWDWDLISDRLESSGMARMTGNTVPLSAEQIEKFAPPEDRAKVWKEVETCLRENRELNLEYRVVWTDGSVHWQLSRGRPFYENGRAVRLRGISMDITERKNAEEALRQSEALLRMTTEGANVHVWSWDILRNQVECPQLCQIMGKPNGVSLEEFLDYVYAEDRASVKEALDKSLREKCEFNVEYRVAWTDGSIHWQYSRGQPLFDDGRLVRLNGVSIDFTARRKTEEALRQSEALLRTTTDGANIGLWSWDIEKGTVEWNSVEYRQFGVPYGKPVNLQMFLQSIHPEDREFVSDEIEKCLREHRELNLEHRILQADGTVRWNQCKGGAFYKDGRAIRFSGMSLDITERKEAQNALRRSEEMLRLTTEGAGVGLWSWDVVNDRLEWNPVEYQQTALRADAEMRLQNFLNCVHPDDRNAVKTAMESCLRERRELTIEYRVVWPDGTVRWRLCKGTPAYVDDRPVRFSGMSLDITERKHAHEALRQQAELLKLAQVLVFDMNETILFWNHECERLYGFTREEALGKNRHELLHSEATISPDQIRERILRDGSWSGELKRFCKNGEKVFVAVHWVLYKNAQNEPLMILESSNDITALKKTEADLQKAQQDLALHAQELERRVQQRTGELQRSLKDMETFCYTIAHDLRAPLRAMSGFTYSLAEDFSPQLGPVGIDYCRRINAASARMSQLISDLLVFGRLSHRELPVQSVDLLSEINKVIQRSALLIEERNAEIKVDQPLPQVCGDAPLIDQILENLLSNAVKFVPPDRRPQVHIYAKEFDHHVRLCIEDNGIGIPPEQRQKIFQPFQRLHTVEYPGTGIGLAIVQRGVEKMGGHVGVESTPEHGSRFWVELPENCGSSQI